MTRKLVEAMGAMREERELDEKGLHPANNMSLLDHFAGRAMTALMPELHTGSCDGDRIIAELSYDMAEAMVAERNKRR